MKLLFFIVVFNLSFDVQEPAQFTYYIQGTIDDIDTRKHINKAKITLSRSDGEKFVTYSNENGFYKFEKLVVPADMDYLIKVEYGGYISVEVKETTKNRDGSFGLVDDFMLKVISI